MVKGGSGRAGRRKSGLFAKSDGSALVARFQTTIQLGSGIMAPHRAGAHRDKWKATAVGGGLWQLDEVFGEVRTSTLPWWGR